MTTPALQRIADDLDVIERAFVALCSWGLPMSQLIAPFTQRPYTYRPELPRCGQITKLGGKPCMMPALRPEGMCIQHFRNLRGHRAPWGTTYTEGRCARCGMVLDWHDEKVRSEYCPGWRYTWEKK